MWLDEKRVRRCGLCLYIILWSNINVLNKIGNLPNVKFKNNANIMNEIKNYVQVTKRTK